MKDKCNLQRPCGACPFSRKCEPGALGGSPMSTYLGQALGPFYLPCHKTVDFSNPDWKREITKPEQCAGAAIFRANIGVDRMMPDALHRLPANRELVFGSFEEMAAHHLGLTPPQAAEFVRRENPMKCLVREMHRGETWSLPA